MDKTTAAFYSRIFYISAILIGIGDAFCWGLYWETERIMEDNPLGMDFMYYNLGMTSFSLLALFWIFLSAAILVRAWKNHQWTAFQRDLFYCIALLGVVCLMTGFEFLFWLDWESINPIPYLLVKGIFAGLVAVFLVRLARHEWFYNFYPRDNASPDRTENKL